MGSGFHTTRWSVVLAARDGDTEPSRQAMASLCEAYWKPLYAFVRGCGHGVDDARDLTQSYFTHLLEKDTLKSITPEAGKFRSFLLASLRNHIEDERRRARALKRGGGKAPISLDAAALESEAPIQPSDGETPETLFERRWALTVLQRALDTVRKEHEERGNLKRFEHLKGYLLGQEPLRPYREVAAELGMKDEAVGMAVVRLRRRFGRALREEIGQTVAAPEEIDDEVRHLLSILRS